MKAEHEVRLETKEVSMIRWICRFTLQERELHRMEPINLVIKRGRLMWFGRWWNQVTYGDGDWRH